MPKTNKLDDARSEAHFDGFLDGFMWARGIKHPPTEAQFDEAATAFETWLYAPTGPETDKVRMERESSCIATGRNPATGELLGEQDLLKGHREELAALSAKALHKRCSRMQGSFAHMKYDPAWPQAQKIAAALSCIAVNLSARMTTAAQVTAPTLEAAADNLHAAIAARAAKEGVEYSLDPEFFRAHLADGIRDFFGVHVEIVASH